MPFRAVESFGTLGLLETFGTTLVVATFAAIAVVAILTIPGPVAVSAIAQVSAASPIAVPLAALAELAARRRTDVTSALGLRGLDRRPDIGLLGRSHLRRSRARVEAGFVLEELSLALR